MSLVFTESFMAFPRWAGDDSYAADQNAFRKMINAAFQRAGYLAFYGDQSTQALSSAWIVRADPINPDRAALTYSSANTTTSSASIGIRKQLGSQSDPIIMGFSLYVPPEFVPTPGAPAASVANVMQVICTHGALTGTATGSTYEAFYVASDLTIRRSGTAGSQSSKTLVPGRMSYLEVRISDGDVRVWLDDTLVLQSTVSLMVESIGFSMSQNASVGGSSFITGAAGRWAVSNWYVLAEDTRAPNVRLGPSTRVIGARADTDVATSFIRPNGYASNAAVAGQDLIDNPTATLQSTNVGDQDIYTSTKDTATASGKLIHAVAVKVLAANLESAPHTLRSVLRSPTGVEGENPRPRELRIVSAPFTKDMYGCAMRASDGKLFAVGLGPCLFTSPPNGNGMTPWTMVSDDGTTVFATDIAFRSDGYGVVARSDGKLAIIPPGSDAMSATLVAVTTTRHYFCVCLPNNTMFVGSTSGGLWRLAAGADPTVLANWVKMTTGVTDSMAAMVYHPTLKRIMIQRGGSSLVITSDDNGTTWTSRTPGMATTSNSGSKQIACDGNYFLMMLQSTTTANYIKRSPDGIAWENETYIAPSGDGSTGTVGFMFGDNGFIYVSGGSSTSLSSHDGGANFRRQQKMTAQLQGGCVASNGDWIMVGIGGIYATFTSALIDAPMVPLSGYQMGYNSSTTNPATGLPWTAAEASQSQFGMRIVS